MSVEVDTSGLAAAAKSLALMAKNVKPVVQKHLRAFGKAEAEGFRSMILRNGYEIPAPREGKIPLVRKHVYVESIAARVSGFQLVIAATGWNENMTNAALSEVLEYGAGAFPPMPHWRYFNLDIERKLPKLAEGIGRELFSRGD